MIKAIIRYALKCLLHTEIVMAYISAIVYLTTNHKTNVWEIYLQSQVVVAGLVIASTTAYVVSYRIARIKRQKRIESLTKDMKSNKEFMDCWNEFKKRNGETMKYIRTKDGILKVDGYDDRGVCVCRGKTFYRDEYIKQADTIEELCDGFYLDDGQEEFCLDDVFTNFDKFKSSYIYNNKYHIVKYEGYGFIKTSKGLIYVAKMNDEGKLCLI